MLFNVRIDNYDGTAPLIESHEVANIKEAREIMRQWAEDGDKVLTLQRHGRVTPIVVMTPDGDYIDIFGQLIV